MTTNIWYQIRGNPVIAISEMGTGDDSDHFQLGFTSLALLKNIELLNKANKGIYHLDANIAGFSVGLYRKIFVSKFPEKLAHIPVTTRSLRCRHQNFRYIEFSQVYAFYLQ